MRIVTVPNALNGTTGLICSFIGNRKDLESLSISKLLEKSKAFSKFHGYPEPLEDPLQKSVGPNPMLEEGS